jgi:hypothetical protein
VRNRLNTVHFAPSRSMGSVLADLRGLAFTSALRRLAVTLALVSAGTMTFGAMNGCDNEGEGERCTFFPGGDAAVNGTSECSAGLICTTTVYYTNPNTVTSLSGNGALGVCCPPAGTASTAPACQMSNGGSTTIGPPTGDGSFDAGPEAGDAAPRDARTDAPKDGSAAHDGASDATLDGASDATKDATTGG